ncbi:MAG: hypothetical protein WBW94_07895, partial [Anaerolineales bacterium]
MRRLKSRSRTSSGTVTASAGDRTRSIVRWVVFKTTRQFSHPARYFSISRQSSALSSPSIYSDYEAIIMLHNFHKVATNASYAASMALNAGIDV